MVINMWFHVHVQQHNIVILFFQFQPVLVRALIMTCLGPCTHDDVITTGQDGGFTLLTLPLCPTHETGLGYGAEGHVQHFRHTTEGVSFASECESILALLLGLFPLKSLEVV